MSTSLDITGKIDAATVELFRTVKKTIQRLKMPYVVVGATARDLVLHHGHGAVLERATRDIDFAIEIPGWDAFGALRRKLAEAGFSEGREQHRLYGPAGTIVDIVPFGQVADESVTIAWPPDGEIVMNVLGFQEACDNADRVCLDKPSGLTIPVATPPGMALLKMIAWNDRERDKRIKDARDLAYLLMSYERVPTVLDALYNDWAEISANYDWDITLAAAHKLGVDAAAIVGEKTRTEIELLLFGKQGAAMQERLITEMCRRNDAPEYEKNERLLTAFVAGFGKTPKR